MNGEDGLRVRTKVEAEAKAEVDVDVNSPSQSSRQRFTNSGVSCYAHLSRPNCTVFFTWEVRDWLPQTRCEPPCHLSADMIGKEVRAGCLSRSQLVRRWRRLADIAEVRERDSRERVARVWQWISACVRHTRECEDEKT